MILFLNRHTFLYGTENLTANTFSVAIESSKNYYWNVVVKDDKGGQTIGQIWNFKTE